MLKATNQVTKKAGLEKFKQRANPLERRNTKQNDKILIRRHLFFVKEI